MLALAGRPGGTERWADAAEATSTTGVLTDGSTIDGMVAYLRANLCRNGIEAMRRDAQIAWEGLSSTSPFRSNMLHVEGLSHLLEGDADRADAFFARAVDVAIRDGVRPFVALLLADRGTAAIERDDWVAAGTFAEQALTIMHGGQFDDYWTSAFVYAWAARVVAQRGDPEQGRQLVAQSRSAPAPAHLRAPRRLGPGAVGDGEGLHRARRSGRRSGRPPAGQRHLPATARARATCRSKPRIFGPRSRRSAPKDLGASSLTTAELRLLPLLPTHLSFREIGERLYVSRHTVKTQAISIYRKLGVSSRSETIDRMHELGLLEQV